MSEQEKELNNTLREKGEVKELKDIILQEEKKVLHLRKHGMNDKIIELIKARIK